MYIYNALGEKIDFNDVHAVEELLKLKKKSGTNPWPVIELCMKIWEDKRPQEWRALLLEIGTIKETRRNKHASSESKGGRYLLDLPEKLVYMIRAVYSDDELPMNKEFFREFARRYRQFAVPKEL